MSVNKRLIRDNLLDLRCRNCLSQIIHYAHALRFSFPAAKIVVNKIDLKSAYRRAHSQGLLAVLLLTIVRYLALPSICLPFSRTYCPHMWCAISKFICAVTSALLRCTFWNADELNFSNREAIPEPKLSKELRELAKALLIDAFVNPDTRDKVFYYFDNLITAGIFLSAWRRLAFMVAVIIDVFARSIHSNEPMKRDYLLLIKKLFAEGSLEEEKVILGWDLDFCRLTVALSEDKFEEWSADLAKVIKDEEITIK